ncbi:hypothetical protein D9615_000289 [Tricholomella constricta]|uniref:Uncharacterized protein n=1 Tax=Tricholomella constricta TaxID=117010 RepID=A0A8H5HS90_9AGAR|nr:hypothetical protein D9615_000289 [Tricholomella constricta]
MPTATSTLTKATYSSQISLKGTIPVTATLSSPPIATTIATLRTLYNRAARAFLLRDIPLTHSLIEAAFAIIYPPDVTPDALSDQRRKWDILRITLESTVYTSPPSSHDALPEPLKEKQVQTPQALLTTLHARSLALFTPVNEKQNANSAYLPSQVLITLVYSSLRVDCPDVGRIIIEDWLSRRDVSFSTLRDGEATGGGYEKVLELYCLQILSKLEQWDYAQEFLEYEGELSAASRESFKKALKSLQAEARSSLQYADATLLSSPKAPWSSRSCSPAPSSSSSSSSLSTTSTNTVVPSTVRGPQQHHSTPTPLVAANESTTSLSSDSTATPRQSFQRPVLRSRTADTSSTSFSSNLSSFPRSPPQAASLRPANLSTYALIKASLTPYLTTSNVSTFFLIFIALPLVSLTLRARHRRRKALYGSSGAGNNVELARRRLQGEREIGVLGRAWGEAVRVVCDTVKMAGSGLV